jgi:2-iminobutanoate/2-iminopropanoate deaminase
MKNARREAIRIPDAWHSGAPYTPAVRAGSFIFISGAVSYDLESGKSVGVAILTQCGLTTDDVVKTTVFLTDCSLASEMNEVYSVRFKTPYPARSTVQVGPLARPEYLIEIEAIALDPLR